MTPRHLSRSEKGLKIGFVGTRFFGTDGVSLESAKWAQVFWNDRHVSYWFAGKLDRNPKYSMLAPHAHFQHQDIEYINSRDFWQNPRVVQQSRT